MASRNRQIHFERQEAELRPGVRRPQWPHGISIVAGMMAVSLGLLVANLSDSLRLVQQSGLWPF